MHATGPMSASQALVAYYSSGKDTAAGEHAARLIAATDDSRLSEAGGGYGDELATAYLWALMTHRDEARTSYAGPEGQAEGKAE